MIPLLCFSLAILGKEKKNKISVAKKKKKCEKDWASKHLHNEETRERNGANICEMRLKTKVKETEVQNWMMGRKGFSSFFFLE